MSSRHYQNPLYTIYLNYGLCIRLKVIIKVQCNNSQVNALRKKLHHYTGEGKKQTLRNWWYRNPQKVSKQNIKLMLNKTTQATPYGAPLVASVNFTSKLAFYLHNFGD